MQFCELVKTVDPMAQNAGVVWLMMPQPASPFGLLTGFGVKVLLEGVADGGADAECG